MHAEDDLTDCDLFAYGSGNGGRSFTARATAAAGLTGRGGPRSSGGARSLNARLARLATGGRVGFGANVSRAAGVRGARRVGPTGRGRGGRRIAPRAPSRPQPEFRRTRRVRPRNR